MILFMRCKRLKKERRLKLCRVAVGLVVYITARVPNNVDNGYLCVRMQSGRLLGYGIHV